VLREDASPRISNKCFDPSQRARLVPIISTDVVTSATTRALADLHNQEEVVYESQVV
jgi:hypothetical protein